MFHGHLDGLSHVFLLLTFKWVRLKFKTSASYLVGLWSGPWIPFVSAYQCVGDQDEDSGKTGAGICEEKLRASNMVGDWTLQGNVTSGRFSRSKELLEWYTIFISKLFVFLQFQSHPSPPATSQNSSHVWGTQILREVWGKNQHKEVSLSSGWHRAKVEKVTGHETWMSLSVVEAGNKSQVITGMRDPVTSQKCWGDQWSFPHKS